MSLQLNIHIFTIPLKCSMITNTDLCKVILIFFSENRCIWLKLFHMSFHLKANCISLEVGFIVMAIIRLTVEVQLNSTIIVNEAIYFPGMYSQKEHAI